MKQGLIYIFILFLGNFPTFEGIQKNPNIILGDWVSSTGIRTVHVYQERGKYKAVIIRSNNAKEVGRLILWDLIYDSKVGLWNSGKIQLPDMEHSAECYVEADGNDVLKITGYHGWRVFGKTEHYVRVQ